VRIATWNVNSIRARTDRVLVWLERSDVDVLAIQETKCRDDQFPGLAFEALGYEVAHHGRSQWNGVAIVSRVGLTDIETSFPGQPAGVSRRTSRRGPWGPPAAACGCGACTSPTGGRSTTRTISTSWTGWPGCAMRRPAG
jgi:exonuclease III